MKGYQFSLLMSAIYLAPHVSPDLANILAGGFVIASFVGLYMSIRADLDSIFGRSAKK